MRRAADGSLVEASLYEFLGSVTGCGTVIVGSGSPKGDAENAVHQEGYGYLLDPCAE